jgi:hypothetical protein
MADGQNSSKNSLLMGRSMIKLKQGKLTSNHEQHHHCQTRQSQTHLATVA